VIEIHDKEIAAKYANCKIPIATFIQLYMTEKADLKSPDLVKTLYLYRYKIFRFVFTWEHFSFFSSKFVGQLVHHTQAADTAEVRDVSRIFVVY
jgi:hypothetical protein